MEYCQPLFFIWRPRKIVAGSENFTNMWGNLLDFPPRFFESCYVWCPLFYSLLFIYYIIYYLLFKCVYGFLYLTPMPQSNIFKYFHQYLITNFPFKTQNSKFLSDFFPGRRWMDHNACTFGLSVGLCVGLLHNACPSSTAAMLVLVTGDLHIPHVCRGAAVFSLSIK